MLLITCIFYDHHWYLGTSILLTNIGELFHRCGYIQTILYSGYFYMHDLEVFTLEAKGTTGATQLLLKAVYVLVQKLENINH